MHGQLGVLDDLGAGDPEGIQVETFHEILESQLSIILYLLCDLAVDSQSDGE